MGFVGFIIGLAVGGVVMLIVTFETCTDHWKTEAIKHNCAYYAHSDDKAQGTFTWRDGK